MAAGSHPPCRLAVRAPDVRCLTATFVTITTRKLASMQLYVQDGGAEIASWVVSQGDSLKAAAQALCRSAHDRSGCVSLSFDATSSSAKSSASVVCSKVSSRSAAARTQLKADGRGTACKSHRLCALECEDVNALECEDVNVTIDK